MRRLLRRSRPERPNERYGRGLAEPIVAQKFLDADVEELMRWLYLRALREGERILDVNAQIANGALDLRVAK
jgi:hypothetical protein